MSATPLPGLSQALEARAVGCLRIVRDLVPAARWNSSMNASRVRFASSRLVSDRKRLAAAFPKRELRDLTRSASTCRLSVYS